MHSIRPFLALLPGILQVLSQAGPQNDVDGAVALAASGEAALGLAGTVRVEIISAATTSSFEGAVGLLERVRFTPEVTPLDRWNVPEATEPIPENGVIQFPPVREGLYQLHLLDALGMPILDEPGPVWVSVVPGIEATYRVETMRLDLVEGVVVEDSIEAPLAGATLRVDPRFAVRGAPQLQIVTDAEGRYRVSTARSEVVAVDSPNYRTVNMRFDPKPVAAPLRMKPMMKRRRIVFDGASATTAAYLRSPKLAYASRLLEPGGANSFAVGSRDPGAEFSFEDVFYDLGILYWIQSEGETLLGQGKTSIVMELLVRRGGGTQKVELPISELHSVRLPVLPPLAGQLHLQCAAHLDRRTTIVAHGYWLEQSGEEMFRLPDLGIGGPMARFTLFSPPSTKGAGDGLWLEWRGGPAGPVVDGSLGSVRAVQVRTTTNAALALVFDGVWMSHGVFAATSEGLATLPHIGPGTLYTSSSAIRGDIERVEIGMGSDSKDALVVEAKSGACSQELRFLDGEEPARWLAVHVVPVGCALSDEILDLLGETPLVTDATGTIHLRGFVPGEYEVRMDPGHSGNDSALQSLPSRTLLLREGDQDPIDWNLGTSTGERGR